MNDIALYIIPRVAFLILHTEGVFIEVSFIQNVRLQCLSCFAQFLNCCLEKHVPTSPQLECVNPAAIAGSVSGAGRWVWFSVSSHTSGKRETHCVGSMVFCGYSTRDPLPNSHFVFSQAEPVES